MRHFCFFFFVLKSSSSFSCSPGRFSKAPRGAEGSTFSIFIVLCFPFSIKNSVFRLLASRPPRRSFHGTSPQPPAQGNKKARSIVLAFDPSHGGVFSIFPDTRCPRARGFYSLLALPAPWTFIRRLRCPRARSLSSAPHAGRSFILPLPRPVLPC